MIGRYGVDDVWREEPCGRVVRARFAELNRPLYIKELLPPAILIDRDRERLVQAFEEECRALGQTEDRRLLRPYDFGPTPEGTWFIAYDRPETAGYQPLGSDPRAFSTEEWLRIAVEAGRSLEELRGAGVPAYPFSPDYVWISPSGEIQILPLGLAHLPLRLGLSRVIPRPSEDRPYEAPETRSGGEPDGPAQVFSLAAWLYAMLARRSDDPVSALAAGHRPEPLWTANDGVRAAIDDVVQRALDPDPARRFPTLEAFAAALEASRGGAPAPVPLPVPSVDRQGEDAEQRGWAATARVWGAWAVALTIAGWLAGLGLARLLAR